MSVPKEGESMYPGSRARADYVIDHATGCWEWQKAKNPYGYPTNRQHRRYYELAHGVDITGLDIHHTCKNPGCINPDHLEAIDVRDHDAHHFLGERAGGLTLEDVAEIKRLGREPGVRAVDVAARFGIHRFTVYRYWNAERWTPEFGDGRSEPPAQECAAPDCSNSVVGPRHKRFCSRDCRRRVADRRRRAVKRAREGMADAA